MKNCVLVDKWTQIKLTEICVNTRHLWPDEVLYKRCQNIIKGFLKPGQTAFLNRPLQLKPAPLVF